MPQKKARKLLSTLQRSSLGVIRIEDVPRILSVSRNSARQLLYRWKKQGWITRLKRGLYLPLPLEAESADRWTEDPWLIATLLFSPCYIGGWSACEYLGLTEQIFRETVVFSTKPSRQKSRSILSSAFKIRSIKPKRLFGTTVVWKGQVKTRVSDPARTILDLFDDPETGGGFRQSINVLTAYMNSDMKDLMKLREYLGLFGNSALYKRLGYSFEVLFPNEKDFIEECQSRIGKGYSKLDTTGPDTGPYLRRWTLRLNKDIKLR